MVLEALASSIPVLLRDIPVYEDWLVEKQDVYKGKDNADFAMRIHQIMEGQIPRLTNAGLKKAKERDVRKQAALLQKLYQTVYAGM